MATPASADQALVAFWRDQLKAPAIKQRRIAEAVLASLLGADGAPTDSRIVVDLIRLAEVAAKGYHLDARAEGTNLVVFVADDRGNEVKPEPGTRGADLNALAERQRARTRPGEAPEQ